MKLIQKLLRKLLPILDLKIDVIKFAAIENSVYKLYEHKTSNDNLEEDVKNNIVGY